MTKMSVSLPVGAPVAPGVFPRIACTRSEIDWLRNVRRNVPLYARGYDALIDAGRESLNWEPPADLPAKDDPFHLRSSLSARGLGYAALLTGEEAYAAVLRRIALYFADNLSRYPYLHEAYLSAYSMHDGIWLGHFVEAVDLLFATGAVGTDERHHIVEDLLVPVAEGVMRDMRTDDGHHRCYNFQLFHCYGVGRLGFLLNRRRYLDWALEDRRRDEEPEDGRGVIRWGYGLKHFISHDIRNDGLFWERSIGYHSGVTIAALKLAETALRSGVNVYEWQMPHDASPGDHFCGNYPVDGDNGPKSLKFLLDGLVHFALPDQYLPGFGDSDQYGLWRVPQLFETGLRRYGDARYAAVLHRAYESLPYGRQTCFLGSMTEPWDHWRFFVLHALPWNMVQELPQGEPPCGDGAFCASGRARAGSRLFPSSGFAVLHHPAPGAPGAYVPGTLSVCMSFGPYGGGHGHPDMLSFVLNHAGRRKVVMTQRPDDGLGYQSPYHGAWQNTSVSKNTVTMDRISQRVHGQWGVDSEADPVIGEVRVFHADGFSQLARAVSSKMYKGDVVFDRALILVGGVALDLFRIEAGGEHEYDWIVHCAGEPDPSVVMSDWPAPHVAEGHGYEFLGDVRSVELRSLDEPFSCVFRADGNGLRVIPAGGTEDTVLVARTASFAAARRVWSLLARRRAASTLFAGAFQPEADTRPVAVRADYARMVSYVEVRVGDAEYRVAVAADPGVVLRAGGMEVAADAAVLRVDDAGLVEGSIAGLREACAGLPALPAGHTDGQVRRDGDGNLVWVATWEPVNWVRGSGGVKTIGGGKRL